MSNTTHGEIFKLRAIFELRAARTRRGASQHVELLERRVLMSIALNSATSAGAPITTLSSSSVSATTLVNNALRTHLLGKMTNLPSAFGTELQGYLNSTDAATNAKFDTELLKYMSRQRTDYIRKETLF